MNDSRFEQKRTTPSKLKRVLGRTIYPVLLFVTGTKRGTYREEALVNILYAIKGRIFNFPKGLRRHRGIVEKQYDKAAGYSVRELFHYDAEVYAVVSDHLQKASRIEVMNNVHEEISDILSGYSFKSILEVGAGELVTLVRVASHFGDDVKYFGVDLSLNRVFHGYQEFIHKNSFQATVAKSDAVHLPFPDNSIDIIITNHCLECIPTLTAQAIEEICRVSRYHAILFEPSYQLGSASQKLKMLLNDYPLNFPKSIAQVDGATLEEPFLLQNCLKPLNRTGCYRITVDKTGQKFNEPVFVCPQCHGQLETKKNEYLYCRHCARVYFFFQSIPLLDMQYSPYITDLT